MKSKKHEISIGPEAESHSLAARKLFVEASSESRCSSKGGSLMKPSFSIPKSMSGFGKLLAIYVARHV
jgi:hypothetical protein